MHELVAALERNPDDEGTWLVYTDYLISIGDPLGELAVDATLLDNHGTELVGIMAELPGYDIEWRHGHARSLRIGEPFGAEPPPHDVLADFLHRPAARFLRNLHVHHYTFPSARDHNRVPYEYSLHRAAKIIDALAARPRPALRSLWFGSTGFDDHVAIDEEGRDALNFFGGDFGDLDRLWPAVSRLERIVFSGGWMSLGHIVLPELRDFELRQSSLRPENLAAVANAQLPKLERLSLWCGAYDDHSPAAYAPCTPAALGDLLETFPGLRSLGIVSTMDTREIAEVVLRSKLLPRLTELDLSGGVLRDADLEVLVRQRDRLAHLETLDLRFNLLDPERARALTTGLHVRIDPQRNARSYVQPRFNACQE